MSHYTISRETWAGKLVWLSMEWGRAYESWETHGQARAPSHRAGEALRKAADDARQAVMTHLLNAPYTADATQQPAMWLDKNGVAWKVWEDAKEAGGEPEPLYRKEAA
jgi:hypothetical protein